MYYFTRNLPLAFIIKSPLNQPIFILYGGKDEDLYRESANYITIHSVISNTFFKSIANDVT